MLIGFPASDPAVRKPAHSQVCREAGTRPDTFTVTVLYAVSGLKVDVVPIFYSGDPQWRGHMVSKDTVVQAGAEEWLQPNKGMLLDGVTLLPTRFSKEAAVAIKLRIIVTSLKT